MDGWIHQFVLDHRTGFADRTALRVAHVGTSIWFDLAVVIVLAVYTARIRRWFLLPAVATAAGLGVLLATVMKVLIARPRPPWPDWLTTAKGSSMPSSVAMLTLATLTAIVLTLPEDAPRVRRWVAGVGGFLSFLAGGAVIYVGVHWTTDVLVGWALGAGIGVGTAWAFRRVDVLWVQPRRQEQSSPQDVTTPA